MCSAGKGDGARPSPPPPPLVDDDRTASPEDELR